MAADNKRMKIKYNKPTLTKLEQLFKEIDYTIRYEKGQFKSGYCIIHQRNIVVINKFFDTKGRIESLLDMLNEITFGQEELPESLHEFVNHSEKIETAASASVDIT